jgi:hypothetical protein
MDEKKITVRTGASPGLLRLQSLSEPSCPGVSFRELGSNLYELPLETPNAEYVIAYVNAENGGR